MSQHVWLVRHGQTGANAEGRYIGCSDVELDVHGFEQAKHLSVWAAGARIGAIVTSPARRAWQTASVVGTDLRIEPRIDERLRELDFGIGEGRTLTEVRQADPEAVAQFELDPVSHHMPHGEHPRDAVSRMRGAIADVLRMEGQRPLLVTHNTVLRLLLCDVLNVPLKSYRRSLPVAEHCAITELSVDDGTIVLRRFNAPVMP